jgi:hypothetical protein
MAPRWLSRFGQTRRLIRALERSVVAQEQTAAALLRIANYLTPPIPQPTDEEIRTSGILPTAQRDLEQARLQDFSDAYRVAFHRDPTDEEMVEFLQESDQGPG